VGSRSQGTLSSHNPFDFEVLGSKSKEYPLGSRQLVLLTDPQVSTVIACVEAKPSAHAPHPSRLSLHAHGWFFQESVGPFESVGPDG
jgi:hypothetical protein